MPPDDPLPPPALPPSVPPPSMPGGTTARPWYRRWWGIGLLVVGGPAALFFGAAFIVALLMLVGVVDPPPEQDPVAAASPSEPPTERPSPPATAAEEPSREPELTPEEPTAQETVEEAEDEEPEPQVRESPLPEIDVIEIDDVGGNRVQVRVVVHGQPDPETVHEVARQLVVILRVTEPYSGLALALYEHEAQCCDVWTLGRLEDAPGGRWEDAYGRRPPEDYDDYEYFFEGRDLDWSQQPTEAQYALSGDFLDRLYTEEGEDEPALMRRIAEEHGVSFETVEDAVDKALFWFFDTPTIQRCGSIGADDAEPCEWEP